MNTRSITLGASVIAIALAGPGSAQADTLGGLGTGLPQTDVAVKVQTDVKANADIPVRRIAANAAAEMTAFFVFMTPPQLTIILPRIMCIPHVNPNEPLRIGVNVTTTG